MALTRPRASQIFDLDYKASVRVITTTNITLSGGAPASVDGVSLALNDRVLVAGQGTASQNGIYYVTTVGAGSNGTWTRAKDGDTIGEITAGMIVMVTEGSAYANTQWKLTTPDPITLGTTGLTFAQNSAYAFGNVYANSTAVVATTVGDTITVSPGNNISITASSKTVTIATSTTVSFAGNVTGGNLITAGLTTVTGNITGGNLITAGLTTVTGNITGGNILSAGNIIASKIVSANDNIVINSTGLGSEGGQLVMAWANVNGLIGQANSTWNMDVDNGNVLRIFYQNAAGAAGVLLQASPTSNVVSFPQSAGVSATGNVTGSYFIGNGSQLTGVTSTSNTIVNGTSNIVVALNSNITVGVAGTAAVATFTTAGLVANSVAATNNGAGTNFKVGDDAWIGDINVADTMSVRGQQSALNGYIVFGNADGTQLGRAGSGPLTYGGAFSASGNVTGGNILTGGLISATSTITSAANITGGNVLTGGLVSATANVIGGNVLTGGLVSATGNITGGNITIAGTANISTFIGNVFFGSVPAQPTYYTIAPLNLNNSLSSATKVQLNLINTGGGAGAGSAIDFYTYQISVAAANAESRIAAIDDGNYSAYLSLQTKTPGSTGTNGLVERVKVDSTGVSVVANITGGNVLTGGIMSSTGNATHGNVLTGGLISATGNITGGNILGGANVNATTHTGATVNVTGNIDSGNLRTTGLISATGGITAASILTSGTATANGNIITGNGTAAAPQLYYINAANTQYASMLIQRVGVERWLIGADNSTANGNVVIRFNATSNYVTVTETGLVSVIGNIQSGNLLTTGLISATGNITGGNVSATSHTGTTVSVTGNITGGNLTTTGTANVGTLVVTGSSTLGGNMTITGHVLPSANLTYDLGSTTQRWRSLYVGANTIDLSGAQIKTDTTTGAIAFIPAATSSNPNPVAAIISPSGGISIANTTAGSLANTAFSNVANSTTTSTANLGVTGDALVGGQVSATGNVTGGNIVTVGIMSSTGNATHGNILTSGIMSSAGNATHGNILTGGVVSATGNVTSGNLTTSGLAAVGTLTTTGNANIGNNLIVTGNLTVNGTTITVNSEIVNQSEVVAGVLTANAGVNATSTTSGALLVSGGAGITGNVYVGGIASATGNVTSSSNIVATANVIGGNLTTTGQVSATGNITGGNLNTSGLSLSGNVVSALNATGNITGPYLRATANANVGNLSVIGISSLQGYTEVDGQLYVQNSASITSTLSVTGNITGGNLQTAAVVSNASISASSNITGGNLLTSGLISATGNIVGGNLTTTGNVTGAYILGNAAYLSGLPATYTNANVANYLPTYSGAVGNLSPGNLLTTGLISVTGGITAGTFYGNGSGLVGIIGANVTGTVPNATYSTSAGTATTITQNAQANITSVGTLTSLSVSGNATSGNFLTGGYISATGNVTSQNLNTGIVSATGNINGSNISVAGLLSVAGNIIGANVNTGIVSATGNIVGGNISTSGSLTITGASQAGSYSTSGNVTGGNLITSGLITSTGNVIGGNLITSGTLSVTGNATTGNLQVNGTINATGNINFGGSSGTINATNISLTDPVIDIGSASNLAPLVMNDGYSRGLKLHYYDTSDKHGFMGLKANDYTTFQFLTNATDSGSTFTGTAANLSFGNASATGNITASYLSGNGSLLTGITTSTVGSGTTQIVANTTAITFQVAGNTVLTLDNTGLTVNTYLAMSSYRITGVGTPTSSTDAATKGYADGSAAAAAAPTGDYGNLSGSLGTDAFGAATGGITLFDAMGPSGSVVTADWEATSGGNNYVAANPI